ncbi:MAG: flagellar hook-associated protein FlgL [Deltaproteobacteria bacterium]|nr:flagellar hook-associated protein FlgL [Deltaproteobacteria bacterium]
MRVSETMLFTNSLTDARRSRSLVLDAQQKLSSGLRVTAPSDDTSSYIKAKRLDDALTLSETYMENIARAQSNLQTSEGVLGEANNVLSRVKELAVQMANGIHEANGRMAAALEVQELRGTLIQIGNTKIGEEYLFAGNLTDAPPFDAAGNYLGDSSQRMVEVGNGIKVAVNVPGDDVFNSATGVDVFGLLSDLETELNNNDPDAIAALLDDIDVAINQVISNRSDLGNYINTAQVAENVATRLSEDLSTEKSRLIDTDVMESASTMSLNSQALEASLAAISKVMNISIINRI